MLKRVPLCHLWCLGCTGISRIVTSKRKPLFFKDNNHFHGEAILVFVLSDTFTTWKCLHENACVSLKWDTGLSASKVQFQMWAYGQGIKTFKSWRRTSVIGAWRNSWFSIFCFGTIMSGWKVAVIKMPEAPTVKPECIWCNPSRFHCVTRSVTLSFVP